MALFGKKKAETSDASGAQNATAEGEIAKGVKRVAGLTAWETLIEAKRELESRMTPFMAVVDDPNGVFCLDITVDTPLMKRVRLASGLPGNATYEEQRSFNSLGPKEKLTPWDRLVRSHRRFERDVGALFPAGEVFHCHLGGHAVEKIREMSGLPSHMTEEERQQINEARAPDINDTPSTEYEPVTPGPLPIGMSEAELDELKARLREEIAKVVRKVLPSLTEKKTPMSDAAKTVDIHVSNISIEEAKEKIMAWYNEPSVDGVACPPDIVELLRLVATSEFTGGKDKPRDQVDHPAHYNSLGACCQGCGRPIECIDVIEHMPANIANAVKYLWRADHKGAPITDLEKASWYAMREIARRRRAEEDRAGSPRSTPPE